MSARIISCSVLGVNPRHNQRRGRRQPTITFAQCAVPTSPLDDACTQIALLAHDLAAQRRTARAAAAAAAGLDAAVAVHRFNEALAWLFDEGGAA